MTDRILFRAEAGGYGIDVRTVSARMKSRRFWICYDALVRLEEDGTVICSDIHSFAKLRLDRKHDRLSIDFVWLTGHGFGRVDGWEQEVDLCWSKFKEFLDACRLPDGPETFKAASLGPRRDRPKLIFDGNRENLKAAIGNKQIRHKLGKALTAHFNWPDADEIYIFNDFVPYSFFFREFRDGKPRICGGLILHGQENMAKAYYGLHT